MVDVPLEILAFWALVTGGTPLIIAAIPMTGLKMSDRVLHFMLGLSAGILLSITFLDILPQAAKTGAIAEIPEVVVPLAVLGGFTVLLLVERHILAGEGVHGHLHEAEGQKIRPFGTLAISALGIHGLIDGLVIPLAFSAGATVGTVVTLAVAVHQIPDSVAALSVVLAAGGERRTAAKYVLITAIDTPIGIVLGVLFLGMGQYIIPIGLAFAAGTFLFVSAADLIPELQHRSRSALVTLSILLGFVIVAGLSFFLPTI
jgi:zinc and cadmium transporter